MIDMFRQGPLYGRYRKNFKWLMLRGLLGGVTIITAFMAVKVRYTDIQDYSHGHQ